MQQIHGSTGVDRGRYFTRTGRFARVSDAQTASRSQAVRLSFGKDEKQSLARRGSAIPAAPSRKERSATALQRMILRRGHF